MNQSQRSCSYYLCWITFIALEQLPRWSFPSASWPPRGVSNTCSLSDLVNGWPLCPGVSLEYFHIDFPRESYSEGRGTLIRSWAWSKLAWNISSDRDTGVSYLSVKLSRSASTLSPEASCRFTIKVCCTHPFASLEAAASLREETAVQGTFGHTLDAKRN